MRLHLDGGGDELDEDGRPAILRHPEYFDPDREPFENMRDSYAPLVWQCRYSGIEVPDALWRFVEFGRGVPYSENQAEHMMENADVLADFDRWTSAFAEHVGTKGKVPPSQYRAYGHRAPSHLVADLKTKWRGLRMALGAPVSGTSPAVQHERGINRDASIFYQRGEGTKVRNRR